MLFRWIIFLDIPGSLNPPPYDCPPLLSWVLKDLVHDHGIPCFADLSAAVEALSAVKANYQHDFLKDVGMAQHEPVLIVLWGHFSLLGPHFEFGLHQEA